MKRWIAAVLLAGLAAPGSAGELEQAIDVHLPGFHQPGPEQALSPFQAQELSAVVASIPLSLTDRYLYTDAVFGAGGGRTIHVAVNRAANCPGDARSCDDLQRYFFLFTDDKGQVFSAGAYRIANYSIFKSGSAELDLDRNGSPYTVRLRVSGLDAAGVEASVLEVSRGGRLVFSAPLSRILDGMSRQAVKASLDKPYWALLGHDLVQDGAGNIRFAQTQTLDLIPVGAQDPGAIYPLAVSKITPQGVLFPSLWKSFAFRQVASRTIEIYRL